MSFWGDCDDFKREMGDIGAKWLRFEGDFEGADFWLGGGEYG